ncbi:FadR/GntR family transcriptional regulator [Oceanobacillus halotolerans]|uniref:FadR/GntR family transcriptional regulator n=1 Tax=Oceanobacillus halotolerans TaxID=2663380 RepID=UPI0013D8E2FE|nr:FadR/GntR family transcriptional regulator [Oceanobacillus halotolerans]
MKIEPIKKTSLSDFVVDQLKGLIIKREIKVGEKLPNERELSQLFDVSRNSVREALRVLELQGLLNRTHSGTYVQADFSRIIEESFTLQILLNDAKYEDIQHTRVMLEKDLVRLAAVRRSEKNLSNIQQYIDDMSKAIKEKDKEKYIAADIGFHREIAEAANNSVLLFLYNTISDLLFKVQKQVAYDDNVLTASLDYHKLIYEAVIHKDEDEAERQLVLHLNDVENRILKLNEMDQIAREEFQNY